MANTGDETHGFGVGVPDAPKFVSNLPGGRWLQNNKGGPPAVWWDVLEQLKKRPLQWAIIKEGVGVDPQRNWLEIGGRAAEIQPAVANLRGRRVAYPSGVYNFEARGPADTAMKGWKVYAMFVREETAEEIAAWETKVAAQKEKISQQQKNKRAAVKKQKLLDDLIAQKKIDDQIAALKPQVEVL